MAAVTKMCCQLQIGVFFKVASCLSVFLIVDTNKVFKTNGAPWFKDTFLFHMLCVQVLAL
jgi:hypothetical protein